jgi:hypothetical protein
MASRKVLVVANETVGGAKLVQRVRELAHEGDTSFALVVPQTKPKSGQIIYLETVHDAASVRLSLARQFMGAEGIEMEGEVGDPDPFSAAMDAIAEYRPDQVIVSTKPATVSGWLRRDLVERIRHEADLPVEHVVVDLDRDGFEFEVTLVVANETVGEAALLERLKAKAQDDEHLFIVVVPQPHGHGHAAREARERLSATLKRFREAGLLCAGMIGAPDPYDAALNALQSFMVSDIVISTFPETKSGWLRQNLIRRVESVSGKPVEHVIAETAPAASPAS